MPSPKHNPKQVEFIEQRKKTDCGVACLAMLTGHLYNELIGLFPRLKRTKGGLYPDDLFEIFDDLGYSYYEVKKLPKRGTALVAIEWKNIDSLGHYVVWDSRRKQFLDPLHGVVGLKDMFEHAKIEYIWKINKTEEI